METLFAFAIGLFILLFARHAAAVTTVLMPTYVSPHLRITVVDDRRPVAGVWVEVFRLKPHEYGRERPLARLRTDRLGSVQIPTLVPGDYDVSISSGPCRAAGLYLKVRPSGKGVASLTTELSTLEETASGEPCQPVVSCPGVADAVELTGIVTDATGTAIPDVRVSAYRVLESHNRCGASARTDQNGRFRMSVSPGAYKLLANMPGFRLIVIPLQVERGKTQEERHIVLALESNT